MLTRCGEWRWKRKACKVCQHQCSFASCCQLFVVLRSCKRNIQFMKSMKTAWRWLWVTLWGHSDEWCLWEGALICAGEAQRSTPFPLWVVGWGLPHLTRHTQTGMCIFLDCPWWSFINKRNRLFQGLSGVSFLGLCATKMSVPLHSCEGELRWRHSLYCQCKVRLTQPPRAGGAKTS